MTTDIVSMARPVTSPLHPFFLWDDQAAARAYREAIARASQTTVPEGREIANVSVQRLADGRIVVEPLGGGES